MRQNLTWVEKFAALNALFGTAVVGSFWILGILSWCIPAVYVWTQENQGVYGWIVLPALLALAHVWIVALWIITSDERTSLSEAPVVFRLVFLNLIAGAAFILRRVFGGR